jgi:two-component sensor histidine kinase
LTQQGPELLISAGQAQALFMAFHELATNAVKHGALSVESGRIEVSWNTDLPSAPTQLRIRWRETGATTRSEPTRRGFGSDILETYVPKSLHGTFERTLHGDGIECVIMLPLEPGRNDERADHT